MIAPSELLAAQKRISSFLHHTPLLESSLLNQWLGHRVVFKCENLQKVGAFKARGALHTLLKLKEEGSLPKWATTYSSGNHAQAVAWAGRMLGVRVTVFMPENVSALKRQATESYGAEVVLLPTRKEAEKRATLSESEGAFLIPPFDHDSVILGQGTAALEALQDLKTSPDAVFVPVGGGGLLSGTYLATLLHSRNTAVYGAEPKNANDAARSFHSGKVETNESVPPPTLADGAITPSVCPRTLEYIRKTRGIFEVTEKEIGYWTQWLTHLLKLTIEPTAALGMAAASQYLSQQTQKQTVLVLLSGGNLSAETQRKIWEESQLERHP